MLKHFCLLLILLSSSVFCGKSEENKTCVANENWQEIRDGQSVPPGIHVRINLTTGKKEGKLLDGKKSDEKSALIATETKSNVDESKNSKKRLEAALKSIPHESFTYNESEIKKITKKFKTYETIKQEFADLKMSVKTDFEILDEILAKFDELFAKDSSTVLDSEVNVIFDDLDYMVHQVDNANRFIDSGGLDKVIVPNIQNQTNSQLKLNSIKLLGTLTQNNPKAQVAAFEKNLGFVLLQVLSQSSSTQEMSSLIYAFGGLIRKFPLAQKELLNKPGLKTLIDLLGKPVDYKIKIKVLKLISDLIREYEEITQFESEFDKKKIHQYQEVKIKDHLASSEYCNAIDELINENRQEYLGNLYTTDDIVNVLSSSKEICQQIWSRSPIFRHTILVIENKYERELDKNQDDQDLVNVVKSLHDLNEFLFKTDDELQDDNEVL